jgi:RecB family exonuclease
MGGLTPRQAPVPEKRSYISPAAAAGLLSCPLQLAYRDDPLLRQVPSTPALRIGTAAHEVLEKAAAGKLAGADGISDAWEAAISAQAAAAGRDPASAGWPPDPRRWPYYAIKRARTVRLAATLAGYARATGDAKGRGQVRLEQPGTAAGGRLRGRIDVVRLGPPKVIEDYKTGAIADPETGEVKDDYRIQMQLYAVIEHERDGVWPAQAVLIPVKGAALTIGIEPSTALGTAEAALAALDDYENAPAAPGIWRLAAPSSRLCGRCPFSVHCGPFWDACEEAWQAEGVRAAAGAVTEVSRSGDSLTLTIDSHAGSYTGALTIRNLPAVQLSGQEEIRQGETVRVTSFVRSPNKREAWWGFDTRFERAPRTSPNSP